MKLGIWNFFGNLRPYLVNRTSILFSLLVLAICPLGVLSGLRHIVHKETFFALYKGNGAQMVRIFPYAATQFTAFELYKKVKDCFVTSGSLIIGWFVVGSQKIEQFVFIRKLECTHKAQVGMQPHVWQRIMVCVQFRWTVCYFVVK